MTPPDVIHALQGVRYVPAGRSAEGLDCWGLVLDVCQRLGWPLPPDPLEAAASPSARAAIFARHMVPDDWKRTKPRDGAIGFSPSMDRALHAGIIVAGGLLDTAEGRGVRWTPIAELNLADWEFACWAGS
ncbi:NlpC/P60 family protein [Hyphomonas sp.]|uniref:NlpC/P60 family protein n=1 Tax=Hyphomonas sp. TaxID=87 RepID=UPI0039191651